MENYLLIVKVIYDEWETAGRDTLKEIYTVRNIIKFNIQRQINFNESVF